MIDEEDRGFGPLPPSPERDESAPAPAPPAGGRSPLAPDWWQPGMSTPPLTSIIRVQRGKPILLRQMNVGEILDTAIKLYRASWRTFVGTSAAILVPLSFIQAFLTRSSLIGFRLPPPEEIAEPDLLPAIASLAFTLIQFFLVTPFLTALFARATADLYLGAEPEISSTLRYAASRLGSILLVSILTGLAMIGGFLLLIVPGVLFYVRFAFGPATVVVEDIKGRKAMGRSWRLARGHFWRLFGSLLLANILVSIVSGIAAVPLALAAQFIGPSGWPLLAVGTSIAEILSRPFAVIVVVLLYFDLRIRKEGFDLAIMTQDLAEPPRET